MDNRYTAETPWPHIQFMIKLKIFQCHLDE